ncbi:ATP-dependent DNA helicase PIF1 [Stylophora pistillata]|uniref:ATP-dependent DNA helicase PIF1 n=1 Tax=Stylophora pistillata TaxID=50429 RepID=A0A2B4R911_STYPI|nr:ATP-dependent DNA helicase PIF1 [Stylophora pistillata]
MKGFRGKQVLITGEFLQLRPVPSLFDRECFMFESLLFDEVIVHRFELTDVLRQDPNELELLAALKNIHLGCCSDQTLEFFWALERPLPQNINDDVVDIYFRRIPSLLHNINIILRMVGEKLVFDCQGSGDTTGISCSANKRMLLKPGCKVILVWNLFDDLKTGSRGVLKREENRELVVVFPLIGEYHILGPDQKAKLKNLNPDPLLWSLLPDLENFASSHLPSVQTKFGMVLKGNKSARLESLSVTLEVVHALEEKMREQDESDLSHLLRKKRITASMFGTVAKRIPNFDTLVKQLQPSRLVQTAAIEMGGRAASIYATKAKKGMVNLYSSGLVINPKWPWLGSFPDRKV